MTTTHNLRVLKVAALFEGLSYIALFFIAVPLKRFFDIPQLVSFIGPVHGVLFLALIALLLFHFLRGQLNLQKTLLGIVASLVPFGTFIFDKKCLS